ncbi:hypothetical protein [Spirillospora sp. CA-128828]|uniref:hypothetical protein n=1 Tax=Spirillospora sp. CA-128828 TaxID=3240033 RepID=UPI003D8EC93D
MPPKSYGPPKPFTTCQEDADEVAKLPHRPALDASDPASAGKHELVKEQMLRWYGRPGPLPTMGNAVVPYVYGRCAFVDMGTAIATATSLDHRVYILGWSVDPAVVMLEKTGSASAVTLGDLLRRAKAQVRGMFWDNPGVETEPDMSPSTGNNVPITRFLDGLPNGAAILDRKLPFLRYGGAPAGRLGGGAHHQKLLVVYGALDTGSRRRGSGPPGS